MYGINSSRRPRRVYRAERPLVQFLGRPIWDEEPLLAPHPIETVRLPFGGDHRPDVQPDVKLQRDPGDKNQAGQPRITRPFENTSAGPGSRCSRFRWSAFSTASSTSPGDLEALI